MKLGLNHYNFLVGAPLTLHAGDLAHLAFEFCPPCLHSSEFFPVATTCAATFTLASFLNHSNLSFQVAQDNIQFVFFSRVRKYASFISAIKNTTGHSALWLTVSVELTEVCIFQK